MAARPEPRAFQRLAGLSQVDGIPRLEFWCRRRRHPTREHAAGTRQCGTGAFRGYTASGRWNFFWWRRRCQTFKSIGRYGQQTLGNSLCSESACLQSFVQRWGQCWSFEAFSFTSGYFFPFRWSKRL